MSENADTVALAAPVGDASRVTLARLALDVVSRIPGVAGIDARAGGRCVTADPPSGVLRGVSVIAQPDGRYEVSLCLVARMVPLVPLGGDIRRRLGARAAREGLLDQLGAVNVEFSQAVSAGETIGEVLGPEVAVGAHGPTVGAGSASLPPASTGPEAAQPPIAPAGPSALPEESRPGPAGTPVLPQPTPLAAATPAPPGSPIVPEELTGLVGSQPPSPDPLDARVPPPGCTRPAPSSEWEPR